MADVVVLGTATADIVVRVDRFPVPGEHLPASSPGWRLGGGAVNLACGVVAAGHRVELLGPLGDDPMARALEVAIQRYGITTARCFVVSASTPRTLILLEPSGERTILGLDQDLASAAYPMTQAPDLGEVDCVWVESYTRFPRSVAEAGGEALLVVPPPPAADVGSWPADIIIGSERQLPQGWESAPYASARRVAGDRLRWVVVTRGSRGADAFGAHRVLHVDAHPAHPMDTTGAGDAFAAGLVSALLDGDGISDAMSSGSLAASAAVEVLQSVPPSVEALDGARRRRARRWRAGTPRPRPPPPTWHADR